MSRNRFEIPFLFGYILYRKRLELDLASIRIYNHLGKREMPIYEYSCPDCGDKFELLRSFSQVDEVALCPACNSEARRLVSAFASFSKDSGGVTTSIGGGHSCDTCSSSSCATCG